MRDTKPQSVRMIGEKLIAREAEVLKLLGIIHGANRAYTLIGGYAVDAYSPLPRYSVDLDIVVARPEVERYSSLFEKNGFDEGSLYSNELGGLETRRFVKPVGEEHVFIDLLVDGVRCRQTEAVWKADEMGRMSSELRVIGVNGSALSTVASREMLISLKLHSGRDPDLRDVVMLATDADWTIVKTLSDRGSRPKLIGQLEHAVEVLSEAGFEGRFKAYFGSRQDEKNRVAVAMAKIRDLSKRISSAGV